MDIYINEANLISFIKNHQVDLFGDVFKLLRQQLNVHFNFPKDRLKENKQLMPFMQKLTEGVGETDTTFDNDFPKGDLKANSANGFNNNQLSSIYWIDNKDCQKLKNTGSIIIAEPGEEIESIKGLFFNQNDYLFEKKYRIGDEGFEKWNDLVPLSLPLTDIIFADPYLFAKKNKVEETIHNTIESLTAFSSKSFVRINAVVFINPDYVAYSEQEIKAAIIKGLRDSTGIKPNVSIVKTRRGHDRTILTNYKRVYSGDTFNYWNDKGRLFSKGVEISFSSLAKRENHLLFQKLIEDFQSIINFNNANEASFNSGDKVSNYLNF